MKHVLSFSSAMPFSHRGSSLKPLYSPRPLYSSSLPWYSLTGTFSTNFSFLVRLSTCSLCQTWLVEVMIHPLFWGPFALRLAQNATLSCETMNCGIRGPPFSETLNPYWKTTSYSSAAVVGLVWFGCLCFSAEEVSWVHFCLTFSYIVLPKKMSSYLFILLSPFGV